MSAKTFVDTNVLIYAHDADAGTKHETARGVLRDLWAARTGVLSTQVLQEFYVNVTRKIATPLPKPSARAVVDGYMVWCIETTPAEISEAFRIEDNVGIGFWDALIVAAARKAGAVSILSEALNAGQTIAGVRIENPFSTSGGKTSATWVPPQPPQGVPTEASPRPDDTIMRLIAACYRAVTPEELSEIGKVYTDPNDLEGRLKWALLRGDGVAPDMPLRFFMGVLQKE